MLELLKTPVIITSDKPRHYNIAFTNQFMKFRIILRIRPQFSPISRNSQHHTKTPFFKSIDNQLDIFSSISATIIKSHSPNHDKRSTVME